MRFYVIPPLAHNDLMLEGQDIFVLAHLYISNEEYKQFINARRAEGRWITLDNSAAERSLVTEDILIECVRELRPSEVIAPDVLFDKDATIANLESFIARMKAEGLDKETQVFGCAQGNTEAEWIECYKYMLEHDDVKVIGMSKIAIPNAFMGQKGDVQIMEARHLAYDTLLAMDLIKKPLHFLGMGDPREFFHYLRAGGNEFVRSTDSCYTVLSAMNNLSWEKWQFSRIPTPHNYFTKVLNPSQIALALRNIQYFAGIVHS